MKNIFTFINDIIFYKKGDLLDNIDDESLFNGYMINRWVSMYSPDIAIMINLTTNRFYSIFETKKHNYKFLCSVLPKCKPRRISYIKKSTKQTDDISESIKFLAQKMELSEREIRYYVDSGIDISELASKL